MDWTGCCFGSIDFQSQWRIVDPNCGKQWAFPFCVANNSILNELLIIKTGLKICSRGTTYNTLPRNNCRVLTNQLLKIGFLCLLNRYLLEIAFLWILQMAYAVLLASNAFVSKTRLSSRALQACLNLKIQKKQSHFAAHKLRWWSVVAWSRYWPKQWINLVISNRVYSLVGSVRQLAPGSFLAMWTIFNQSCFSPRSLRINCSGIWLVNQQ